MARDFGVTGAYLSKTGVGPIAGLTTAWSFSTWVYMQSVVNLGAIFTHGLHITNNLPIVLAVGGGGGEGTAQRYYCGYWVNSVPAWRTVSDTITCPTNVWTHMAGTFDGTTLRIYRNGIETNNSAVAGAPAAANSTTQDFYIGRSWGSTTHPDALIEHVSIWDVTLNASEIAMLSKGINPRLVRINDQVMYVPILGTGSPERDYSGVGNHMAIVGAGSFGTVKRSSPTNPFTLPTTNRRTDAPRTRLQDVAAAMLVDDPEGMWTLQDLSGNPDDSTDADLDMTAISAGADYRQAGPHADVKSIFMIGGESTSRSIVISNTDDLTLETWFNPDAVGLNDQTIIANGNLGSNGYAIVIDTNGKIQGLLGGVAFLASSAATLSIGTGTWYHLVLVRESGTWKYYINGQLDTANAGTTAPNTPTGSSTLGSISLQGFWSLAAIYDTALSAARVQAHYNALASGFTDEATVYLDLQPSSTEAFAGIDAATVALKLTPSGIEGFERVDAATVYLDLQPEGTEYTQPLMGWWDPLPEGVNKWFGAEGNKWAQTHGNRFTLSVRGRL